jgi:hypothetical protein
MNIALTSAEFPLLGVNNEKEKNNGGFMSVR